MPADLFEYFEAVHIGQADVEDDQVEFRFQYLLHGSAAGCGDYGLHALFGKALGDEGRNACFIFYNEYFAHSSSFPSMSAVDVSVGNAIAKTDPAPSLERSSRKPPCAVAIAVTTASPSPDPGLDESARM